jgi:hypothetical protein
MFSWNPANWFLPSTAQTQNEAETNIEREKQLYVEQLNKRVLAGQITSEFYQAEMFKIENDFNLLDPTGETWQAFADQFVLSAEELPDTITKAATATATWAGTTAGNIAGGVVGGVVGATSKQLWKNIPVWVWILAALIVGFLAWGLAKGKIKPVVLPL